MSVFYSFFSYLGRIGIPEEWRGFLVGLEPMSAFALRLAIIPLVHMGNAVRVMLLALCMTVIALCSYTWAVTLPWLIVLRIFHGATFVLLVSASMALVVHLIPGEKSAQGFSVVSVSVLIPYAVMPLAIEALLPYVKNEASLYAGVTLLALPGFVLLCSLRKRIRDLIRNTRASLMRRPSMEELRQNLKHSAVILILAINLFLYLGYSTVFYFVKAYFKSIDTGDPGRFFTISTLIMIMIRVLGGTFFDRINKVRTLTLFTFLLIPWFFIFGHVRSPQAFDWLSVYYGLCIGIVLPLLNAVMFRVSPEQFRGLNTNLALFMMDTGFFLSPYAGGLLLAGGWSFGSLFNVCSGFLVPAVCLLLVLGRYGTGRLENV